MSDTRKQNAERVVANYRDSRRISIGLYLTLVEARLLLTLTKGVPAEAPEPKDPQPMLEDPRPSPQTPPRAPAWPTLGADAAALARRVPDPPSCPFLGRAEPPIPQAWDIAVPPTPVHTEDPDPDVELFFEVELETCRGAGAANEALCLVLVLDASPFPPPIAPAGLAEAPELAALRMMTDRDIAPPAADAGCSAAPPAPTSFAGTVSEPQSIGDGTKGMRCAFAWLRCWGGGCHGMKDIPAVARPRCAPSPDDFLVCWSHSFIASPVVVLAPAAAFAAGPCIREGAVVTLPTTTPTIADAPAAARPWCVSPLDGPPTGKSSSSMFSVLAAVEFASATMSIAVAGIRGRAVALPATTPSTGTLPTPPTG